ncbi:MAG: response regulator [Planctomycetaceae bacterium]|nr:response regulator [Planctomycetaceae bacterium]
MDTPIKDASIFFVDDEVDMRRIARIFLEDKFCCYVKCFDSGYACLEALKNPQRECHLLITDVNMPGMDGMALLKEVKQLRPWLSVLLVTGYGNVPMAVKALKSGAMDFLERPVDTKILFPLVTSALHRSLTANKFAGKPLTNSEKEILKLIAEGNSNSEMAALLHRSIRTIERHRYLLMRKLNVSSPAELTKAAIALGLTSPDIL